LPDISGPNFTDFLNLVHDTSAQMTSVGNFNFTQPVCIVVGFLHISFRAKGGAGSEMPETETLWRERDNIVCLKLGLAS